MQITVHQTDVRTAITEEGRKPILPRRIYRLDLSADTDADFQKLQEILDSLKAEAREQGTPVIEEAADKFAAKSNAAKYN